MPIFYHDSPDDNAPYQAAFQDDEEGVEYWSISDRSGNLILGNLSETEARRWAVCWNYCQFLSTEQLERKVAHAHIPLA